MGADFARIPPWARMTSSAILVLAAAWNRRAVREPGLRRYARYAVVAMSFGFLGDLLLAGLLGLEGAAALAAGMGAFALGHGAYLRGLLAAGPAHRQALFVGVTIAVLGWAVIVGGGASPSPLLTGGALAYSILLGGVAGLASGLALRDPAFTPLALGAILFLASDLVLSFHYFQPATYAKLPDAWRGDVVWLLYGTGQMLLVFGAPLAQRVRDDASRYRPVSLLPSDG